MSLMITVLASGITNPGVHHASPASQAYQYSKSVPMSLTAREVQKAEGHSRALIDLHGQQPQRHTSGGHGPHLKGGIVKGPL